MHDQAGSVRKIAVDDYAQEIRSFETSFASLSYDGDAFDVAADLVTSFQRHRVALYGRYWDALRPDSIPFLPIRAFKESCLIAGDPDQAEAVFLSSGTGEQGRSRHFVRKTSIYKQSFEAHLERLLGKGPCTFVAHLPAYSDHGKSSSLVYMANGLIEKFGDPVSGFFLDDTSVLSKAIHHSEEHETLFVLLGAAFGLYDLVDKQRWRLPSTAIVIETGGMKTRAREVDRPTLHQKLSRGFRVEPDRVWSEYGMCEMLSQCYAIGNGPFFPPPWVRFQLQDIDNPLLPAADGEAGLLALIDLANMYSVSAILTEDIAIRDRTGFSLRGRAQGSDLRGCNQLLEST